MTVAGSVSMMKCAYCGQVRPWGSADFPNRNMAECRDCIEIHIRGEAKRTWWTRFRAFVAMPKKAR